MEYEIIGQTVPAVAVKMRRGDIMYSKPGAMVWRMGGISMTTSTMGGLPAGLERTLANEPAFLTIYKSDSDNTEITFGSSFPGSIVELDMKNGSIICQKGAFLCAEETVNLKVEYVGSVVAGMLGGSGFILEKIVGIKGMAFLQIFGDKIEKTLAAKETIRVSSDNLVAFDPSITYNVEMVNGIGNVMFGGDGMFITRLTGPGRVIMQTQNFNNFAARVIAKIPKDRN